MNLNRRKFTQSIAALFAIPALPSVSAFALPSASTAIPTQAKFWAIYMSGTQGVCTPEALQAKLNIPASQARKYISNMISEGVIKPNPLFKSTLSHIVKDKGSNLFDRLKNRFEIKSAVRAENAKTDVIANALDQDDEISQPVDEELGVEPIIKEDWL